MKRLIPAIMIVASVLVAQPAGRKMAGGHGITGLTEREREEAMGFVREFWDASRLRRLEKLRLHAPLEFERRLEKCLVRKKYMERLRKTDPKLYRKALRAMELERESFDLAEKYQNTVNEREKKKIREQLRTILSEQFDLKEKEKSARIKKLEEEITRLKDELVKREKNKKTIVEKRLKDLLGESKYLNW